MIFVKRKKIKKIIFVLFVIKSNIVKYSKIHNDGNAFT
jgi:hypothetical protein